MDRVERSAPDARLTAAELQAMRERHGELAKQNRLIKAYAHKELLREEREVQRSRLSPLDRIINAVDDVLRSAGLGPKRRR